MTLDLKDRLYTSSEVAEILGVSLRSVYRYLEEGKLDADIKTATGRHRFSKKNILDFLQPGGITKDQIAADPSYLDDDLDVLDLPAISKGKKLEDENSDDFSFDIDEDFFKSLDFDTPKVQNASSNGDLTTTQTPKLQDGDYIDDDLEKLLKEFEEKEGLVNEKMDTQEIDTDYDNFEMLTKKEEVKEPSLVKNKIDDDFDFDLDDFFKELEEDAPTKQSNISSNKDLNFSKESSQLNSKSELDDFFGDLDQDEDEAFNPVKNTESKTQPDSDSEDEDNWLERFRKAAQKNSVNAQLEVNNNQDLSKSVFSKSNLDHFFEDLESPRSSIVPDSSIAFNENIPNNVESKTTVKIREFYYSSSLNGLKEIAQNIDKIARKFDTDYAFTMNAGLSLHKPISPFTLIHAYVRHRDLELFEDYLNLSPVDSPEDASVCLMIAEDPTIFEDAYELHGLTVVSNVQLRSDLIDKGLDRLAREI